MGRSYGKSTVDTPEIDAENQVRVCHPIVGRTSGSGVGDVSGSPTDLPTEPRQTLTDLNQ